MPKERVLSVEDNKPLLAMGITNKELPGLVNTAINVNKSSKDELRAFRVYFFWESLSPLISEIILILSRFILKLSGRLSSSAFLTLASTQLQSLNFWFSSKYL